MTTEERIRIQLAIKAARRAIEEEKKRKIEINEIPPGKRTVPNNFFIQHQL